MGAREDSEVIGDSVSDPAAFGVIFDRHVQAVYRYVRRRASDGSASDMTSEVFERAFRDRARFVSRGGSALPWLLGIATNLVRMEDRSERRRRRAYLRAGAGTSLAGAPTDIEDRLDAAAARGHLFEVLAQLPVRQRDVLLLSAWGDLSPAEIAVALHLSPGTTRSDLHRARSFVASRLALRAPHLVPDQDTTA
jgi:RNA polymerase sigma factor (sigma-70 family)